MVFTVRTKLDTNSRSRIVALHEEGLNLSEISRLTGVSRKSVRLWVKRHKTDGDLNDRPRPGKPRLITADQLQRMREAYHQQPYTPTRNFAEEYHCTAATIRNALHRGRVHHVKLAKTPTLSKKDKTQRVSFARTYRDFDFSCAIFSDEKAFTSNMQGYNHLWRVEKTRNDPHDVSPAGTVVVSMWAWMSAAGPGELVMIPRRTTSQTYAELLEEVMVPTVRVVYPERDVSEIVFIQSNTRVHRSQTVSNWIAKQPGLKTLPWPSRSPDLNPMENLWGSMVQEWDHTVGKTAAALVSHVNGVWESFRGTPLCADLVSSMRRRCDAVIDAGGAMTAY